MPERKSAGLAGRLSTVALITGMALVLLGGAFATDAFFHPTQSTASSTSTQVGEVTQSGTSTSSSEGGSTTLNSASKTSTLASSTFSTSNSAISSSTSTFTTSTTSTLTTSTTTTTSSSKTTTTTTVTSSTATQPGTAQITLPQDVGNNESLDFQPSKIKVVIGVNNTIVWNDQDYVQHTVKSVSVPSGAKPWDSGILNEGQTFTLVLTVPGNYKYVCSIHPDWMIGTIQVVQRVSIFSQSMGM